MGKPSEIIKLIWIIAANEAGKMKHQNIEPVHLLISICRISEFKSRKIPIKKLSPKIIEGLKYEIENLDEIFETLNINHRILLRSLQKALDLGDATYSDGIVHRSEKCKKVFINASALANEQNEFNCLHLLSAILENPEEIILGVFEDIGINLETLRITALDNASRDQMVGFFASSEVLLEDIGNSQKVLLIIDGPNSYGKDYADPLDLRKARDYAYEVDKNAKLYFFTKIHDVPREIRKENPNILSRSAISQLGYRIFESHKDIDIDVQEEIRTLLKTENPPNTIILGTKDKDYLNFIKNIRDLHQIKVILAVPSKRGIAECLIPVVDDIKYFSSYINTNVIQVKIKRKTEQGDYLAYHPSDGKKLYVKSRKSLSPDQTVKIRITGINPNGDTYFAMLDN